MVMAGLELPLGMVTLLVVFEPPVARYMVSRRSDMMAAMSAAGVYRRRSFVAPSSGVGAELSDVLLSAIRFSGLMWCGRIFLGSLGYSRSTGIHPKRR